MPPARQGHGLRGRQLRAVHPVIGLFFLEIHTLGGSALLRWFLILLIWDRRIDPGKVFDVTFHSSGRPM
jgi:hypothetical protein